MSIKIVTIRKIRYDSRCPYKKTRMYVRPEKESFWENFVNRRSRPSKLYRTILPEAIRQAELPEGTKAMWSQKAGCSCGCCPGFVLTCEQPYEVYVTVSSDDPEEVKNDGTIDMDRVALAVALQEGMA